MIASENQLEDPDRAVLERVVRAIEQKEFVRSILFDDSFDDWQLTRDFGNFLVRIEPGEILGHALLTRALRHLGEVELAREELKQCRNIAPHHSERELLLSFLAEEERFL